MQGFRTHIFRQPASVWRHVTFRELSSSSVIASDCSYKVTVAPGLRRVVKPLRLMPLGGSVTYGQGSSDGNGYREVLRQLLTSDGFEVEMVGSRKAGSMKNNNHEGWRGFRIEQILSKAKKSVPVYMPDIFTVNAGSNDCLQDFELDSIEARMELLLDTLWDLSIDSTIILSTLLVNAESVAEPRFSHANQSFRDLVARKLKDNRRIVLIDMRVPEGPQLHHLVDGTHPNDEGYRNMAALWQKGILEAHAKGLIPDIHRLTEDDAQLKGEKIFHPNKDGAR